MQTLRKKTSPLKYKNETSRFLGEGVSFKAKLIGILEVSEARGDRMCQEALSDLKMAIRAAGEHKQRITINIAIDGLRLRDEKTGDSLYHHPVHKISFIAQDMTDSRAFGYIFGSPDTGHRFFGIKTDKAASQVVIAMRDLFQVVFALKKKEIELAKQHLDKNRYGSSAIFSESTISSAKALTQESASKLESKTQTNAEVKSDVPAVADLVDLELELNSLQQGITQMERITPSDPFGSKDDPFGDSFTSYSPKPILPPPPSGRERSSRASESSSIFSPKTPHTVGSEDASAGDASLFSADKDFTFGELNSSHDEPSSGDWFTPTDKMFEETSAIREPTKEQQKHELAKQEILSQFDVFTELDPLGNRTGKIKPYIDKKDFFQELKNPPKKVLNDLVVEKQKKTVKHEVNFNATFNHSLSKPANNVDPFADDPFDKTDPFSEAEFGKDPFDTDADYKIFKDSRSEFAEQFKFPSLHIGEGVQIYPLSKSPNKLTGMTSSKHYSFDVMFNEKIAKSKGSELLESDCAPEPPPRPVSGLVQIKPPPLPPKKQSGEFTSRPPPPRPPYAEEPHYDSMDNYETAPSSLDVARSDKSPQLPAPARKAKFETDFSSPPQRPKKQFNLQQGWSSEEDYLTPISLPKQQNEVKNVSRNTGPLLLPPPQKSNKKHHTPKEQKTVAPYLDSKPIHDTSLEGLDITLSQLTLSGLNELASKLNIPAHELSNMTLVQLTEYISNYIKNKTKTSTTSDFANFKANFDDFKADFANFNNFTEEPQDKYAVFRELLQEEIKQTKIDTEPEELRELEEEEEAKVSNLDVITSKSEEKVDRYAALREIVESEMKQTIKDEDQKILAENTINEEEIKEELESPTIIKNETNIYESEKKLSEKDIESSEDPVIEYSSDTKPCLKSPIKVKSPVPSVVTEVTQTNRPTSGSLSDVVSGSSPEVDNTGSTSEVAKKSIDAAAESWAIFDQPNLVQQPSRDKQSEEGVSPWSSDSKEFGNGSPPEWRQRPDSANWRRRPHKGWWDTSAEPGNKYYPSNRRSTDSYEDEVYDYYEKPPRRRRQAGWASHGGHSSSSRDASPWEEEPRRKEMRDMHRETWSSRHTRGQHSFERQDRRHADSWDEEDDYEYDEEHSSRYHWPERHPGREPEKERGVSLREREPERWTDDWGDRRHKRRRDMERDRWCCPDWEQGHEDHPAIRYSSNRWRDRKQEERYYARGSQESQWDDEYPNEPEESLTSRYIATKRNWKRPSSASEMDRKTGENKSRQYYMGTGGSDGERDRRYKGTRRSRSRDAQFAEAAPHARHKAEPSLALRGMHRTKPHVHPKENDFQHDVKKADLKDIKRSATLGRKKTKDSPKEETAFSRSPMFENSFAASETESPISAGISPRFTFENDFETSEAESPMASKPVSSLRFEEQKRVKPNLRYDTRKTTFKETSPSSRTAQRSPFEDDFSPSIEKPEHENICTSSIKEEIDGNEEEDSFGMNNFDKSTIRRKMLSKNRIANNFHADSSLKKSESVNIFVRESDPFDDEFFSPKNEDAKSPCKWTEDFDE